MKPIGIDTESSYEEGRDIRSLGVSRYVNHPDTDHYMVSVYAEDFCWVGDPETCSWDQFADRLWVSHNAAYDKQVIAAMRARGINIPVPPAWHCTADLASFLQSPRSLLDSCRELLGIKLDKTMRDEMKGKDYRTLDLETKGKLANYALLDAKACYLLWTGYSDRWPEDERQISDMTSTMCAYGVGLDLAGAEADIETLKQACWAAGQKIPWFGELTLKGKPIPVTSSKMIAEHCRKLEIPAPESTDATKDEYLAWEATYAEKAPFVAAVREYRKANRLLTVMEAMRDRHVTTFVKGASTQHSLRFDKIVTLPYSLKYFGAVHTGRWSGGGGDAGGDKDDRGDGLNMQNFPRAAVSGVDARSRILPRPGCKFVVADFSQIETRISFWLARDEQLLMSLRQGVDVYEAHARNTMGYKDPRPLTEVDPAMRFLSKTRCLSLIFGVGAEKFRRAYLIATGKDLGLRVAKEQVGAFRASNPGVTDLWSKLEMGLRNSAGGTFNLELPSGRVIQYFDVLCANRQTTARVKLGGPRKFVYGAMLLENLAQATAREIFAAAWRRLADAGFRVVMIIHDEFVIEVPEETAEDAMVQILQIMRTSPDWASTLPIGASGKVMEKYGK